MIGAAMSHAPLEADLISAAEDERLLVFLKDLEDAARVRERSAGPFVELSLDDA